MASGKSKAGHIDRYNAGVAFYNKGEFSKAIAEFRAALSASPKSRRYALSLANAYNNRGVAKYRKGEYAMAGSDFKKAHEADKSNGQYVQNMKLARESARKSRIDSLCKGAYEAFNRKRYGEAVKMLKGALKEAPNDGEIKKALAAAYNGRGVALYAKGKFMRAADEFELAMKEWPAEGQYKLNMQWSKEAAKRASKKRKK